MNRNLGEAYAAQGSLAEAVRHYDAALRVRPDDVMLLNRVGWILATTTRMACVTGARPGTFAERRFGSRKGWTPNRWIPWRRRKLKPGSLTRQSRRCAAPWTVPGLFDPKWFRSSSNASICIGGDSRFGNDGTRIHE